MFATIYLLCLPALLILAVTAMVRVNDIGWTAALAWHWHVRRLGLVMVGSAAVAFLLSPVWADAHFIFTLYLCTGVMVWGFALSWLTTPGMPPWWKYITRGRA